jgi:hypothetical protein
MSQTRTNGLLLAALCAFTALPCAARAEIVQIPAITFVNRAVGPAVDVIGESSFGTLTSAAGTLYAAVPFPTDGLTVCKFTLVHRDNDGDFGIEARLLKKRIKVNDNPFTPPVQMARVYTGAAGSTAGVRRKSDLSIKEATIDLVNGFYYVELTQEGNTLEVLGVQIEYAAAC